DWSLQEEQLRVRSAMSAVALAAVHEALAKAGVPAEWVRGLKSEIAERIALDASDADERTPRMELMTRLRHAALRAERGELLRLWRGNAIGDEVMHHLMEKLDYEEARLPAETQDALEGHGPSAYAP